MVILLTRLHGKPAGALQVNPECLIIRIFPYTQSDCLYGTIPHCTGHRQSYSVQTPFQLLANMEYVFWILRNSDGLVIADEQYERHLRIPRRNA